ncbi:hypothetical protein PBRA_005997 [Plasmodiophora brassicae]|uniref:Uncharacterized protein n=1 Tax=Plasmodiophora brassicae TaxID=37360 RepID=A0A0G4IR68_PLABS|nr:hypothetical protein PBRA_005997 [Plasmodiophora brassicae]
MQEPMRIKTSLPVFHSYRTFDKRMRSPRLAWLVFDQPAKGTGRQRDWQHHKPTWVRLSGVASKPIFPDGAHEVTLSPVPADVLFFVADRRRRTIISPLTRTE